MLDRLSTPTTYTAAGFGAALGALSINEWGVILSVLIALATAIHNAWHKRQIRKIAMRKGVSVEVDE